MNLFSDITNWFNAPFDENGDVFVWVLWGMVIAAGMSLWWLVLYEITKEA